MLSNFVLQDEVLPSRTCGSISSFSLIIALDLPGLIKSILLLSKLKNGAGLGRSLAVDCLHGTLEALALILDADKNRNGIRAMFMFHVSLSPELKDGEGGTHSKGHPFLWVLQIWRKMTWQLTS